MACPSEDDRQSLQRTKESFENRWTNVRRTVPTKRRQAEERLLLCKEFWNEYEKFAEWINETENAVKKSEEGMTSGLEISKSRLKRFEVRRKNSYKHLKALANQDIIADTLLPTQMFPRLPARASFVGDTNFVSGTKKKCVWFC